MHVTWCIMGDSLHNVNLDTKAQYMMKEDLATASYEKLANEKDFHR